MASLIEKGRDGVFKMPTNRKYDFSQGEKLGPDDHIVFWKKPQRPAWLDQKHYQEIPNEIAVREVRKGSMVVVTTLYNKKNYPKKQLIKLYTQTT